MLFPEIKKKKKNPKEWGHTVWMKLTFFPGEIFATRCLSFGRMNHTLDMTPGLHNPDQLVQRISLCPLIDIFNTKL